MQTVEVGQWVWNLMQAATPFTAMAIILTLVIQFWRKQVEKRTDMDADALKRRDDMEQKQRELEDARARLKEAAVRHEADQVRDQERWMEIMRQMREVLTSNQVAMDQKTMAMIQQSSEHSRQLFELLSNLLTSIEMLTAQLSRVEQKVDSNHSCPIVREGKRT